MFSKNSLWLMGRYLFSQKGLILDVSKGFEYSSDFICNFPAFAGFPDTRHSIKKVAMTVSDRYQS